MESAHLKHSLDEGKKQIIERMEEIEEIKSICNELRVQSAEKSE